jgi:hypothetical protein
VKICGLAQAAPEGSVWFRPNAEEVDLAADFFAPLAVVMGGEGKRGVRLGRFAIDLGPSGHGQEAPLGDTIVKPYGAVVVKVVVEETAASWRTRKVL